MADITSKMLDVRIGTSNDWAQENLSLVAGNLYYVDLMKNDGNPSGAMALFLAMGTTKADARYLTTLIPSVLDTTVSGDVAVGDTLVTALSKLNNKIKSVADDAAKMFTIRGTIGTDDESTPNIPTKAEKGDAWRIVTAGTYQLNGKYEKLEVGDWIICSFVSSDNTPTWVVLQANLDLSSVTLKDSKIDANGFVINLSGAGITASTTVPFANTEKGGLLTADDFDKLNNKGTLVYKSNTATASDAGVVMVIDATDSDKSEGYAATPKAVKSVKDALDTAKLELSDEQKAIVKGIEVDNATHSTDSKQILVQNEAGEDFHADFHVLAKDEGSDGDGNEVGVRLNAIDTTKTPNKYHKVIVNEADHSALSDAIVVEDTERSVKAVEIEDTEDIRLQSTDEVGIVSVDHADLADDLGGRQETTPEEFIYQPTAGEHMSIKDGMASIERIKGNSVVWNQKVHDRINVTDSGLSVTKSGNVYTVNGTSTKRWAQVLFGNPIPINQDRKCVIIYDYLGGSIVAGGTNTPGIIEGYRSSVGKIPLISSAATIPSIKAASEGYPAVFGITGNVGDVYTDLKFSVKIHDLTQMFGEGNEPTTVEEFNARKPKIADEYAYNEGEIISFNGDAIKSVGFNQWDEEWELGTLNQGTGATMPQDNVMRSKNFIPCLPNTKYYFKGRISWGVFFYDEHFNYLGQPTVTWSYDSTITTPTNARYFKFAASTINNNYICINLSHTGVRDGEYEPYTEHTLYLPSAAQDMKSAGTAYDEIYWDETRKKYVHVQRIGSVDMGTLTWSIGSVFTWALAPSGMASNANGLCECYDTKRDNNDEHVNKTIRLRPQIHGDFMKEYIGVKDTDYTDAATFKAAMSGVMLYYELAEPIITEITDYEGYMDYPVSDFGTEEVLSLGNTAPLKADIEYGFNAVDTIRNNRLDISNIKTDIAKNYYDKGDVDSKIEPINNTIDGILSRPMDLWGMNLGNGYRFAYEEDEEGIDISPEGVEAKVGEIFIVDKTGKYFSGTVTDDENEDDIYYNCSIGNVLVCTKAGGQDAQFAMYDNYKDALYAIATKRIDGNASSIAGLSDRINEANGTAADALSAAENAEMYAEQANNLSNYILDDIETITLSTSESDGKVTLYLDSNGITVGEEGGYVTKGVDAEVQIPNATSSKYGLMSPDHVDKLNSLYKPHSIGTVTTVTELKTSLNAWLATNKGKIVAATFQCSSDWRTNWANPDKQDTAFATGSTTWTAQVIAAYSTDANHVCLMISSYSENNQCIVCRAPAGWFGIRQIAFFDTKINEAFNADKATLAEKATNDGAGNNISDTYLPKSGGEVTGDININNQLLIEATDGHFLPQTTSVRLGDASHSFESAHIGTIYGSLSGTAEKALNDGNGKNIASTYAKATDLAAIRTALTWKPFTNNSN